MIKPGGVVENESIAIPSSLGKTKLLRFYPIYFPYFVSYYPH
jgi:hypothetical protein